MTPIEAAAAACTLAFRELVRIGEADGYRSPLEVASVVAELQVIAGSMEKVLDQAGPWLADVDNGGNVGVDQECLIQDPQRQVLVTLGWLADSSALAADLARSLACAVQAAGHLTAAPVAAGSDQ